MIYLLVILFLLLFIIRYDINGRKENRDTCYFVTLIAFILIAGLRYRLGSDTTGYLYNFYHGIPTIDNLKPKHLRWDEEPLFTLMNSIVLTLGGRFYMVQLIHATFVNALIFKYIKRHSNYIFTCLFFYFIWMYTFYNMEELRASMALVVCLYANDYILEKKWLKSILLFLLAGLFHKSAFVLLVTPVLFLLNNKKYLEYIFLLVAFLGGIILQENFGDYFTLLELGDSTSNSIEQYMKWDDQMSQDGRNLTFFVVNIIPFIVYPLFAYYYTNKYNKDSKILKIQLFLFIGIAFVAMQASMQIMYRYVHFYALYIIIFISQLFIDIIKNAKPKSKGFSYVKSFIIAVPLIVLIVRAQMDLAIRYLPYSSVIEKSINYEREKESLHPPFVNEY